MTQGDRADHDDVVSQLPTDVPDPVETARRAWRDRCDALAYDVLQSSHDLETGLRALHDSVCRSQLAPGYEVWRVDVSLTPNHRNPSLGLQHRTLDVTGRLCAVQRSVSSLPRLEHEDPSRAPHEQALNVWAPTDSDEVGTEALEAMLALMDACNASFPPEMSAHSLEQFHYARAIVNLSVSMVFIQLHAHEGSRLEVRTPLGWEDGPVDWAHQSVPGGRRP